MLKIKISNFLYTVSVIGIFFSVFFSSLSIIIVRNINVRILFLMLATSCFLYLQNKRRREKSLPQLVSLMLLMMTIVVISGFFFTKDAEYEAFLRYGCILICMIFGFRDTKWITIFFHLLFLCSLVYILSTIWLYFDHNSYFTYFAHNLYPNEWRFSSWLADGYTAGVTDHYSTNGMVLANAVIISFSYAFVDKRWRFVKWGIVFLALIALLLTGKRAHLLFGMVGIMGTVIVFIWNTKNRYLKYLLILFTTLISFVLLYSFSPTFANYLNRFSNMGDDINITGRYVFWAAALSEFKRSPMLGIGWFGFRNIVAPTVNYSGHCHNIYIQLLCETGLIGSLFFYSYFIISLLQAIKCVNYTSKNRFVLSSKDILFSVFSLSYQIYFLLYGITGNPIFDAYNYPVYYLASGISIHYFYNKNRNFSDQ